MAMKKSFANKSRSKAAHKRIRSFIVKTSRWSCFEGFRFWGFDTPQLAAGSLHWLLTERCASRTMMELKTPESNKSASRIHKVRGRTTDQVNRLSSHS